MADGIYGEPSAVRFFHPEHPTLALSVRAKLERMRADEAQRVADGYAQSWENYRYRVGIIKGLDAAIEFCIEAEKDLRE